MAYCSPPTSIEVATSAQGQKIERGGWRKTQEKWWRLQDVLESAAPPVKHDAEVRPVATDASTSPACSEAPDASETPARVSLPDDRRTTAAPVAGALSPSQIAKNEIAIEGRLYVSAARLASMLGISERTLSRRCANGNGPPHVKLAGIYYDLDEAQEWTAEKRSRH